MRQSRSFFGQPAPVVAPVPGGRRITLIDALRGYALMGLFLIHMVEYFELYWLHPEPGPVHTAMFALFGGKAYAIFALLFGLSFYIILERQAARGVDFRGRFAWRVFLLLLLGTLHGLLYGGDILQVLAVAGFVVLPFWRAANRTLLAGAALCLLQVPTFLYGSVVSAAAGGYERPFFLDLSQAAYTVYAHGTFADVLAVNAWQGMQFKWSFMLESGRFSNILGLALTGCYLGRIGFFVHPERYRRAWWLGLPLLVVAWLVLTIARDGVVAALGAAGGEWLAGNAVDTWRNTLLAGATVLVLALGAGMRLFDRVLAGLAPAGRMSLTVYVAQSILCVPLFYGFGLGAHAWIGQARSLAAGLVLWVCLVAAAHAWMRRFHYGPLEWLWRALTLTDRAVPLLRRQRS